jgi:hypothetical protein
VILIPLSVEKGCYPASSVPLPSRLTFCTPTESSLHVDSFAETVIKESALYELLTFHNQDLTSIFRLLSKERKKKEKLFDLTYCPLV